jgi:hypothetical protein
LDGDEILRSPASKEEHKEDQVEKEAAELGLSVEQFKNMLALEAENAANKVRIPRLTSRYTRARVLLPECLCLML